MRVAYVSPYDAHNIRSWSGTGYYIPRALEQQGVDLTYIGDLRKQYNPLNIARYLWHQKLRGVNDHPQRDPGFLRHYARQVEAQLENAQADVLFAPGGLALPYVNTDLPVAIWTDCTFASMTDYYAKYTNLSARTRRNGHDAERRALERCDLIIMACQWAADSAVNDYGIDPAKIHIVPFGANIPCDRTEADINAMLAQRSTERCELAFIGVDWRRKGGPLALAVVEELNRRGIPTHLTVYGCAPDIDPAMRATVTLGGFADKSTDEGLAKIDALFRASHFLLLPTQAEAFGIVFCEANSFGVPAVATRTGGVPSVVHDDVNGRLFALDAPAAEYADYIQHYFEQPAAYAALSQSSFRDYQQRLNWHTNAGIVLNHLESMLATGTAAADPASVTHDAHAGSSS